VQREIAEQRGRNQGLKKRSGGILAIHFPLSNWGFCGFVNQRARQFREGGHHPPGIPWLGLRGKEEKRRKKQVRGETCARKKSKTKSGQPVGRLNFRATKHRQANDKLKGKGHRKGGGRLSKKKTRGTSKALKNESVKQTRHNCQTYISRHTAKTKTNRKKTRPRSQVLWGCDFKTGGKGLEGRRKGVNAALGDKEGRFEETSAHQNNRLIESYLLVWSKKNEGLHGEKIFNLGNVQMGGGFGGGGETK